MRTKNMNLVQLIEDFGNDDECVQYLEELRWPHGVKCPRCSNDSISRIATRGQFDCNSCRYRFSVTSGTIFHDTHLPLIKWFLTVYMMIEAKKGMSATQIMRSLGIGSYRTAWYLTHRIRAAMKDAYPFPLRDIVEVDETFVGGKVRDKDHGYRDTPSASEGMAVAWTVLVARKKGIHTVSRSMLHTLRPLGLLVVGFSRVLM